MRKLTKTELYSRTFVCASHALHLFLVANLSTNQKREHPEVEKTLVASEDLLVVVRRSVRDQHDGLVTLCALASLVHLQGTSTSTSMSTYTSTSTSMCTNVRKCTLTRKRLDG